MKLKSTWVAPAVGFLLGLFGAWCHGFNFDERGAKATNALMVALALGLLAFIVAKLCEPEKPKTPEE